MATTGLSVVFGLLGYIYGLSYNLYKNGMYSAYNPLTNLLTNLLRTSWDIQACVSQQCLGRKQRL